MAFSLKDRWVWDFWFAQDRELTHMFFLNAPKSLGDPEVRHWNVSIGHAVSHDLVEWREVETALQPSIGPSWDDYTTWTGSVLRAPDGQWMMFYTGTNREEKGLVQRIGAAVSADLHSWQRVSDKPLLEVNPELYEALDLSIWHDQAFRDPWVFRDAETQIWHMVFTAREPSGPAKGRGVLGHATSTDLKTWALQAPLFRSKVLGQLEVPQIFELDGRWYCLFCIARNHVDEEYAANRMSHPMTGVHYLVADNPLGPWELVEGDFLVGDAIGHYYSGRVVRATDGDLRFLAFRNLDDKGQFIGGVSDPMAIRADADGKLVVELEKKTH